MSIIPKKRKKIEMEEKKVEKEEEETLLGPREGKWVLLNEWIFFWKEIAF